MVKYGVCNICGKRKPEVHIRRKENLDICYACDEEGSVSTLTRYPVMAPRCHMCNIPLDRGDWCPGCWHKAWEEAHRLRRK